MNELAGYTIGVTADRRRDELAALLERRGARVVIAPALRIVPLHDDSQLREATRRCLDDPPNVLVANTGIGMRGWLEAADGWGLAEPLHTALSEAYIVARGPKARGAVRAAGLHDQWSPDSESCDECLAHLLRRGVKGQTVAVQLHGEQAPDFSAALRAAASAPAVAALLTAAGTGADGVLEALRSDVLAACVGPVTAAPLIRQGIPVIAPARARLGALVRAIVDELPLRSITLKVAGHELVLRGHAAMVDGHLKPLAPAPMAVLRALAGVAGKVRSRASLLPALPRGADEHAVEMAVARLRAGLGDAAIVQTVVKRGYRLPVD